MFIQPVRSDADYQAALAKVSALMDLDPDLGTPEGDQLDVLMTLVQAYESKHHPIEAPSPVEAIKFRMDQAGLTVADMVPCIGPRNRVYEVLNGKRPVTMPMIRRLLNLGIPAASLVGEPEPIAA
ncbi:helix-turn-helix domain-containing protein [Variovorax sp. RHLX14]|uniref:helix-turn-helix domain-containing protein n=1 Tax=Variovorax sp. RHLX14 TaxID=1259731 RepID=UPI003F44DD04